MSLSDILLDKLGKKPRKGSRVERARSASGVGKTAEWRRIAALPAREPDLDRVPDLSPIWRIDDHDCPGCDLCAEGAATLRTVQSAMLLEAEAAGGLAALVGPGHGKELTTLLLPEALDAKRAVIITKPRLKHQLLVEDIPRYGRHFRLPLDRLCGVLSYSELQVAVTGVGQLPQAWKWLAHLSAALAPSALERLRPDAVIANEGHSLKYRSSARGWRTSKFLEDHPSVKFCYLTGSPGNRRIVEYAHLVNRALGGGSPLPRGYRELDEWDRAISVPEEREDKWPVRAGALLDLCGDEVREAEIDALSPDEKTILFMTGDSEKSLEVSRTLARRIYRRRLASTRGVVVTEDTSVDIPLVIAARHVEVPDVVRQALDELRATWVIGGEELREAKDISRYAKQLACGFYYRWAWPDGVRDEEWLEARQRWRSAVRRVLQHRRRPGMDTPLLVARAAQRRDPAVGPEALDAWPAWEAVRGRWRPHPPREAVWLSDFVVQDCLAWAAECSDDEPGIIWYDHDALGDALAAHLPRYGGGKKGDRILASREPCVAASRASHSDGKNLQHFRRCLVTTPPANGGAWEQMLARPHRPGQQADEVEFEVYAHDEALRGAVGKALQDARFQEEAHKQRQRLLQARREGLDGFEPGEDDEVEDGD